MAEKRYDNVTVQLSDGTTLQGHDAVAAHFEREQALLDAHGATLVFQVYRADLEASTLADLQGPRLTEIRWDGGAVSGSDTVAMVKQRLCAALPEIVGAHDQVTLFLDSRPMQEENLFYADHFLLLPVFLQLVVHQRPLPHVLARIQELASSEGG